MKREAFERGYIGQLFVLLCLLVGQLFSQAIAAPFLASAVIPNGSAIQIVRDAPQAVVTNGGAGSVTIYSANSNSRTDIPSVGVRPVGVAVSPSGRYAYIANGGQGSLSDPCQANSTSSFAVIDLQSKTVVQNNVQLGIGSQTVVVDAAGTRAYVANLCSGTISVLDISAGTATFLRNISGVGFPQGMALSADGRRLYIASTAPGKAQGALVTVNTVTDEVSSVSSQGYSAVAVALNPAGTRLYLLNNGQNGPSGSRGSFAVFDISGGGAPVFLTSIETGFNFPLGLTLTTDGSKAYIANAGNNTVSVVDLNSNSIATSFGSQGLAPFGVSLTPDNALLYVTNRDSNYVSVFNTSNLSLVANLPTGSGPLSFGNFVSAGLITSPPAQTFGAIINGGDQTAVNCGVSLNSNIPVDVTYRAISGATQTFSYTQPTNVPVNVAPGAAQVFFLTFTPRTAFAPSDIAFNFSCDNAASAKVVPTLNTFVMSANATAVPNMVALVNTTLDGNPNEDADVDMYNGVGQFIVASASIGAAGTVRVSAAPYTGFVSAAPSISVCELVPSTQNCVATPGPYVDVNVTAGSISSPGSTPAFKFFVTENGPIADSPEQNRIIVRFFDTSGAIRGATQTSIRSK